MTYTIQQDERGYWYAVTYYGDKVNRVSMKFGCKGQAIDWIKHYA